jgi:DNA polymerase III delta subunit
MKEILFMFKDADYYFSDELYQSEVESKDCLLNLNVEFSNKILHEVSFYDRERFYQDLGEELESSTFFYEENIIFLKKVNKENILDIIEYFEEKKYI